MKRIFLLIGIFIFLSAATSFADIVYLRDGRIIKGKVISETKYSVKIDTDQEREVFYYDEIDSVEYSDKESTKEDQTIEPIDDQEVSEQKRELVLELLKANGTIKRVEKTISTTIEQVPQDQRLEVKKYLNADELTEVFIPIYASYFSEEQLQELIDFYNSDAGKRQLAVAPKIMEDTVRASGEYFKSIIVKEPVNP